jgi:hypothetical protein
MANKKQKRMERDPKARIDGKPIDVSGKIKIDIDPAMKKLNDDITDTMRRMAEQMGAAPLFGGGSPKERGWGGPDGRPAGGNIWGAGVADFVKEFGVAEGGMYPKLEGNFKNAVASMIFRKAVEVWDNPINWTFGVGYNTGQRTFWFTAKFYDDEGTLLVEETTEVAETIMEERNWDESCLVLEGELEKMHERCEAEIAMFEEDGE